jgi:hypothetical protein
VYTHKIIGHKKIFLQLGKRSIICVQQYVTKIITLKCSIINKNVENVSPRLYVNMFLILYNIILLPILNAQSILFFCEFENNLPRVYNTQSSNKNIIIYDFEQYKPSLYKQAHGGWRIIRARP